jgi:hypothetical protein
MVAVLPIARMRRMAKPGTRRGDRRDVFLPGTTNCGTSLRVN